MIPFAVRNYSTKPFITYKDFKNTVDLTATIVQTLAIIIGGLWAFHKFGWEKKCENIITLKAVLMEYSYKHNLSAGEYHNDKNIVDYKVRLLVPYQELIKKIHLSYYVTKKLRDKIFDTIWLKIGNDTGKEYKNLGDNWKKFEKQLEEIYAEFDKILSI